MARKYGFEATFASILFIVLFGVILLQILGRTPIAKGPVWTEELARWIWVWMALIGIGTVERDRAHLRMGFVVDLLPKRLQKVIGVLTDLLYLGLAGHLVWIAFKSVERTWDNASVTLPMTDGVLYASALVALVLIVLRILQRLANGQSSSSDGDL
jgi:TRAP-type C4-dicarboxylate transport system permease small subunit